MSPNMMMNGTAAQQSNSKASTVELAIEYIKSLQKELGDVKGKLEAFEKEKGNEMAANCERTNGVKEGS